MKSDPLRKLAVEALLQIESRGAFTGLARRGESGDPRLERRLTDLVAGITRNRRWLDFLVDSFYSGNPETLELQVRVILRMGIYELIIARTPAHAAINECVSTGKEVVGKRVAGLINGILRNVLRNADDLPVPDSGILAQDLAVRFSHPDWIVERWLARFGESDTRKFLIYNNDRPTFGVRVRVNDITEFVPSIESDQITQSRFFPDFVRTRKLQGLLSGDHLSEGRVLIQDEAAGGVIYALDPQPGERILDICAAPGGKAISIAERVGTEGYVVAADIHEGRLKMVKKEAQRLGLKNLEIQVADARTISLSSENSGYDRVLVDAPCSGLGVLSKRADLRWRKTQDSIIELVKLQTEILNNAALLVRPGGVLLYSTCTTEPEENEGVVDAFLREHKTFTLESVADTIPVALATDRGEYRTLPFRDEIDGAFAVRFRRRD